MVQFHCLSAQNHNQDDGFHEIQLNGKQLVFLFMAATVVSVVIFLCGVLVGRGVRAERGTVAADASSAAASPIPDTPATAAPAAPAPAGSDPTKAAPPDETADDLSYFNRLEKPDAPKEELKPATEPAKAPEKPAAKPAPERKTADVQAPAPAATAPADGGFALQVAALRERVEAEAIAKRLSSKGYSAYVLAPATGTPSVYRVRVGQFKTRREAETVAARLQKEEQFKPWITR